MVQQIPAVTLAHHLFQVVVRELNFLRNYRAFLRFAFSGRFIIHLTCIGKPGQSQTRAKPKAQASDDIQQD
jgi:hypothetical protein